MFLIVFSFGSYSESEYSSLLPILCCGVSGTGVARLDARLDVTPSVALRLIGILIAEPMNDIGDDSETQGNDYKCGHVA